MAEEQRKGIELGRNGTFYFPASLSRKLKLRVKFSDIPESEREILEARIELLLKCENAVLTEKQTQELVKMTSQKYEYLSKFCQKPYCKNGYLVTQLAILENWTKTAQNNLKNNPYQAIKFFNKTLAKIAQQIKKLASKNINNNPSTLQEIIEFNSAATPIDFVQLISDI